MSKNAENNKHEYAYYAYSEDVDKINKQPIFFTDNT